jgi:adenosylcobinamide-GDP ribazoletransferase
MSEPNSEWTERRHWLAARAHELSAAIAFETRLPIGHVATDAGTNLAAAAWALPVAGVVIGIIAAIVYALAHKLGLAPWPAAALALAASFAVSGGLHEDGLADTADGFGGGKTSERKLEIMRDSRIGTFGVAALIISFALRAGAMAEFSDPRAVAAALIAAHTGGRAIMPALMALLPPARNDGLSFAAGRPELPQAAIAAAIGFVVLIGCIGFAFAIIAAIMLAVVTALTALLSQRQIGGQTGDVIGALEQIGEIVILLVALR